MKKVAENQPKTFEFTLDNLKKSEEILKRYTQLGYKNIQSRNYSSFFLDAISGHVDPQIKRKIIGRTFIKMRNRFLNELNFLLDQKFLFLFSLRLK